MWRLVGAILVSITLTACASSREQRAALEARKENVVLLNQQLAAVYMQREQYEVALAHISKSLALAPDNPSANNVMALLQWRMKNYDEAKKYFDKALKEDRKNAEARNNYGAFLCERGEVNAAVKQFDIALSDPNYPTPAEANANAGMCLMKKPAPVAAERYFREALRLDPKSAEALLQMAQISYDSGRTYSARGFVQRYFEIGEDTPKSLLLAVKIESKLGGKDAEASYALRLKGKFPNSAEAQELHQLSLKGK
ncbi:MAG: type IV pilus biogenesis/stability protein PilW [Acidiferrobacterales bacterium]